MDTIHDNFNLGVDTWVNLLTIQMSFTNIAKKMK